MIRSDHYYGTALLGRLGGIPDYATREIAWACAAVGAVTEDLLPKGVVLITEEDLKPREEYLLLPTSLKNLKNCSRYEQLQVLVPFHYPPALPGSYIVAAIPEWLLEMLDHFLDQLKTGVGGKATGTEIRDSCHRLGIVLHALQDSVAHQGFSGVATTRNDYPREKRVVAGHRLLGTGPDRFPFPAGLEKSVFEGRYRRWLTGWSRMLVRVRKAFSPEISETGDPSVWTCPEKVVSESQQETRWLPLFELGTIKSSYTAGEWSQTRWSTFFRAATQHRLQTSLITHYE